MLGGRGLLLSEVLGCKHGEGQSTEPFEGIGERVAYGLITEQSCDRCRLLHARVARSEDDVAFLEGTEPAHDATAVGRGTHDCNGEAGGAHHQACGLGVVHAAGRCGELAIVERCQELYEEADRTPTEEEAACEPQAEELAARRLGLGAATTHVEVRPEEHDTQNSEEEEDE